MKKIFWVWVVSGGVLFVWACQGRPSSSPGSGNKQFGSSGSPVTWQLTTEIGFGHPFISRDGSKFVTIKDNDLVAYDPSGNVLWSVSLGEFSGVLAFDSSENLDTICLSLQRELEHFFCYDGNGTRLFSFDRSSFPSYVTHLQVSGSGNYVSVVEGDPQEAESTIEFVSLLDRQGNRLWGGKVADGMDYAISYDANFIEADDKVYNRSGQLLYTLESYPWPGVSAVPPTFSRNELFIAYSWGSRHSPFPYTHFDFRSAATGQLLWRKDELIFFSAISDNGEKIAATGPKGLFVYDTQGNQIFYHDPGYSGKLLPVVISMDGRIVVASMHPQRELLEDSNDPNLGAGWGPASTDLFVVYTPTTQILYQENLGDIGISDIALSSDGLKLVLTGDKLLKFYDLTNVVPPAGLKGGMKPPPPGGG